MKGAGVVDLKERRAQQRSERTRSRIKSALIELLDERSYLDLTIADISRISGVATGGFYFHFPKKADLLEEVIREHSEQFWSGLEAALLYQDPYSALFHASTTLVNAFREAPGLVRCFNQLAMTDRTYVRMWSEAAGGWADRLVRTLSASRHADPRLLTAENAHALLSFADVLLFKIYIERDDDLAASAGAPEQVVENLAVLWHRALIGCSPSPGRLAYSGQGRGI